MVGAVDDVDSFVATGLQMILPKDSLSGLVPESKEVMAALMQLDSFLSSGFSLEKASAFFVTDDAKVTRRCPLDSTTAMSKSTAMCILCPSDTISPAVSFFVSHAGLAASHPFLTILSIYWVAGFLLLLLSHRN